MDAIKRYTFCLLNDPIGFSISVGVKGKERQKVNHHILYNVLVLNFAVFHATIIFLGI